MQQSYVLRCQNQIKRMQNITVKDIERKTGGYKENRLKADLL